MLSIAAGRAEWRKNDARAKDKTWRNALPGSDRPLDERTSTFRIASKITWKVLYGTSFIALACQPVKGTVSEEY